MATLDADKPNAYLLIGGNETALTKQVQADVEFFQERATEYVKSGRGEVFPIVDKKLAEEIQLWARLQHRTAASILDRQNWTDKVSVERETAEQTARTVIQACQTGATITYANKVASKF